MTLKCEISKVYNIMLTKKLTNIIYIYIYKQKVNKFIKFEMD